MKKVHIDAAIQQRRAMQAFIHIYISNKDPNFVLPETLLPNLLPEFDEEDKKSDLGLKDFIKETNPTGKICRLTADTGSDINIFYYSIFESTPE